MKIDEAIDQALEYETRIRDLYRQAAEQTSDPKGERVYRALADDEQRHIDYLEHKRRQWRQEGVVTAEVLPTAIPPVERFQKELHALRGRIAGTDLGDEKRMLSKALQVEVETSEFYRRMTATMEGEAQAMFARFQEIEDGHIAAVQAELDFISDNGFWFDFKEFDMEY